MGSAEHDTFTTEWCQLLDDAINWLPKPIRNEVQYESDANKWSDPIEASSFLKIILCIKEADLSMAMALIEQLYETSAYSGTLFLLRARVHFLLGEFEDMMSCLKHATDLAEDPEQLEQTSVELANLLSRMKSNENVTSDLVENRSVNVHSSATNARNDANVTSDKGSCFTLSFQTEPEREHKDSWSAKTMARSSGNNQVQILSIPSCEDSGLVGERDGLSVSALCAVWSQDKNRWNLMESHLENLLSQSVNCTPIYILECGDRPPSEFEKYCHIIDRRLSIYEAWEKGIQFADTDLVMNLNLDDRLRLNAVELLRVPFQDEKIMCVGGEWHVRFNLNETASYSFVESIGNYDFAPAWPPVPLDTGKLRLGSGTGERGTYGPATMWRKSLFTELPYPTRFGNGDLIESIADAVFWHLVKNRDPSSIVRIPLVVGDYLSSPGSQAEFRVANEHEKLSVHGLGR